MSYVLSKTSYSPYRNLCMNLHAHRKKIHRFQERCTATENQGDSRRWILYFSFRNNLEEAESEPGFDGTRE